MSKVIKIDWTTEEGTKFLRNPGEYIVNLVNGELDEDDEGKQFINWSVEVKEGKEKGSRISFKTFITPKALWKLRELLESVGYEINGSVQDLDIDDVVETSKAFVIEVEESDKERSDGKGYYLQVTDFMSLGDYKNIEEDPREEDSDDYEKLEKEIDDLGLDIDLDDYDTLDEAKEAVEKAKKKLGKPNYTQEMLDELGSKELLKLAEEIGVELDEEASTRSKRKTLANALRKIGRLEE